MENKKTNWGFWLSIIGVVLGVLAITMMFLPAMSTTIAKTNEEVGLYNTFQLMFGKQEKGITIIEFSFANCISLLLIILGIVTAIFNLIKGQSAGAKFQLIASIIAGLLFSVGGILSIFAVDFTIFAGGESVMWNILKNTMREAPILTCVISCIAGICSVLPAVLKPNA